MSVSPSPFRVELGATLRLAGPLAAANLLQMAIGAIDVIFVARLGQEALAASSLSVTIFMLISWSLSGLTGAVAPLTTAVMASVDQRHVGTANGFNSAIARTGGLIATALLGSVLAASGRALETAFDRAVIAAALSSALAGIAALVMLRPHEIADGKHAR